MSFSLSIEVTGLYVDVELGVCEQTLELHVNALIFFRKPKLNTSDSDKPIFKLSK